MTVVELKSKLSLSATALTLSGRVQSQPGARFQDK